MKKMKIWHNIFIQIPLFKIENEKKVHIKTGVLLYLEKTAFIPAIFHQIKQKF